MVASMPRPPNAKKRNLPEKLLAWYDVHRRVLPWRAPKGKRADPYRVWLSEIMLQQTTVQAVANYYRKFLSQWPDVKALANAPQDDVLAAWAGLGYYARARNLHAAAKLVAFEMGGTFPTTAEDLRALPGVGGYTSAAIAAIAYDEKQAAMDANAERVIARAFAVRAPLPQAKKELHALCQALVPERAGDFAQGLMDLGSAICTPKRPACANCPWVEACEARKLGIQEQLPVKAAKMARPLKRGAAFVARDASGAVLLVKRPDKGLLASMLEPPLGPWGEDFPKGAAALKQAPFEAAWKKCPGIVRHGFTHFELEVEVYAAEVVKRPTRLCHPRPSGAKASRGEGDPGGKHKAGGNHLGSNPAARSGSRRSSLKSVHRTDLPASPDAPHPSARGSRASPGMAWWVKPEDLRSVALPTVMRKIVEHGLEDDGPLFSLRKP
jgi:A/G-specific adenine glycosylase